MDSEKYGWELDHQGIMFQRILPSGVLSEPQDTLQLIIAAVSSWCRPATVDTQRIRAHSPVSVNPLTRNHSDEEPKILI